MKTNIFDISLDNIIDICSFLYTNDMLSFSLTNKFLYNDLLNNKTNMIVHQFTVNKNILSLDFIEKLPYKLFNVNISGNQNLSDKDFKKLKGIHTLSMWNCDQHSITDKAFEYLKGIHTLDMLYCDQYTITDKAFKNLKGIHSLNMSGCRQNTITNKAFEYLEGISYLCIELCN